MAAKMQFWRLLFVMCLLVAAILCVSLIRSFAATGGQDVAFHFFGACYSLHAQRGKLSLMVPPHARSPDAPQARDFIQRLSNNDLRWKITAWPRDDSLNAMAWPPQYPLWKEFSKFTEGAVTPPLLQALQDPQRFAVAHALLAGRYPALRGGNNPQYSQKGPIIKAGYDGLLAHLTVVVPLSMLKEMKPTPPGFTRIFQPAEFEVQDNELVRLDPEQRFALSHQWDSRLHVRLASVHHGWLIALFLAPPAWTLWRCLRRRAAVRRGQCGHCGYDLRGSSQQCPECGAPIVYPKATSSAPA